MQICALGGVGDANLVASMWKKRNYPRIVQVGSRRKWMAARAVAMLLTGFEGQQVPEDVYLHIDDNVGTDMANEEKMKQITVPLLY
ncbi:hypothetical protein Hamer_G030768 [Homarus americanus]|uniref:Uncharacterized protein n=1 Tax=Homarus americanus TaxID=6706 RepID=A0A8J5JHU6_HOMAM|nr:hypothetical protein Hamer_G030768 [Homarus americanus]